MAKNKNVDIWENVKTTGGGKAKPSSLTSSNSTKTNSKKKTTRVKGSPKQNEIKNPLTIIETTKESDANISTAVSAALSKAINEDYEVEKLNQILDVVIDQVEDPNLSSENFERKNFNAVPLFLVITSIILAVILIPLVALMGFGLLSISEGADVGRMLGYRLDETEFSIKDSSTGKYLTGPDAAKNSKGLSNIEDKGFYFTTVDNNLLLNHDNSSGISYSLVNDNGNIKWVNESEVTSGIYLSQNKNNDEKYLIGFENSTNFLSIKNNSELGLENKPNYFTFSANVELISKPGQLKEDYNYLYGQNLTFGISGNSFSMFSTKTNKYVNSYKKINYSSLPFISLDNYEYYDSLTLSNSGDYNFFINPDSLNINESFSIGSYQTTQFDWSRVDDSLQKQSTKTQYPLLKPYKDSVVLQQYEKAYDQGIGINISETPNVYSETQVSFLPNQHDMHKKAIYFNNSDSYLSTVGGLHLQKIESPEEYDQLDYFSLDFGNIKNPDNFAVSTSKITNDAATIKFEGSNYSNSKALTFSLLGYSSFDLMHINKEIKDIFDDTTLTFSQKISKLKDLNIFERNNDSYYKGVPKSTIKKGEYILKDLKFDTWYMGVVTFFKDENGENGKNASVVPLIFKTADENNITEGWPNADISLPLPEVGDPTTTGSKPATLKEIRNTLPEINSKSVNISDSDVSIDVAKENMIASASNSLELSINLKNGEIDNSNASGVVLGIKMSLYTDEDKTSLVSEQEYSSTDVVEGLKDGDYTFLFEGLSPSQAYYVELSYSDIESNWYSSPTMSSFTTERVAPSFGGKPEVINAGSDYINVIFDANKIEQTIDTDQLKISIIKTNTNEEVVSKGWESIDNDGYWVSKTEGISSFPDYEDVEIYYNETFLDPDGRKAIQVNGLPNDSKYKLVLTSHMQIGYSGEEWKGSPAWTSSVNYLDGTNQANIEFFSINI